MTTQLYKIENEKDWLEKRKGYVTSTEVSALFGLSDYITPFELYHIKKGDLSGEIPDNDFMMFGRLMEQPVADMVKAKNSDWIIEDYPYFAYDDDYKIGSSFDRTITVDGKKYLLEIKTTSYKKYKEKFVEHSDDDIEAPAQYEVQMHTQLELVKNLEGFEGVLMAVMILDTRQLKYIFRLPDEEIGNNLKDEVKKFWDLKEVPEPDYTLDKKIISQVMPKANPDLILDATKDEEIQMLASIYKQSKDIIKQEQQQADESYAKLMHKLGENKYAWTNDYKITVSDVKENKGKVITQDMVGQTINARKGFKKLLIKEVS